MIINKHYFLLLIKLMVNYYKACTNSIVTLEPLPDTINNEKRKEVCDVLHAKFRCNRVKVISIINPITNEDMDKDRSIYDENFIYKTGKIVNCPDFNKNINKICGRGIHYFKTKETAVSWFYQLTNNKFPDGKMTEWYENGNKAYEKSYKNGNEDGTWTAWYKNGNKRYEESYKNGEKDGTWIGW